MLEHTVRLRLDMSCHGVPTLSHWRCQLTGHGELVTSVWCVSCVHDTFASIDKMSKCVVGMAATKSSGFTALMHVLYSRGVDG
jgi:hypothetical protein